MIPCPVCGKPVMLFNTPKRFFCHACDIQGAAAANQSWDEHVWLLTSFGEHDVFKHMVPRELEPVERD